MTGEVPPIEIPVPIRGDSPPGFATATTIIEPGILLTSWVEGAAAVRVGVLDLRTANWRVLRGVRGMLRAALPAPNGRILLLTEHGLFEADLETLEVTRRLTAKIGHHNDELRWEADGKIAIGQQLKATEALVSIESFDYVGRQRRTDLPSRLIDGPSARQGMIRVLAEGDGILIGATSAYASEHGQRMLVLDEHRDVVRSTVMRWGVASAILRGDGIIAAPQDLSGGGALYALPRLRATSPDSSVLEALAAGASVSASALLATPQRRAGGGRSG